MGLAWHGQTLKAVAQNARLGQFKESSNVDLFWERESAILLKE
jgi:hypothetical protein